MAQSNIERERELRVNGSNANKKMCFEVRAPSSTSPPSLRRIFNPLTCPPRTPTEGTSTEDFGQYNWEYRTPLSTNTTSTEVIQMVYRRPEYRTPQFHQYNQLHLTERDTSIIHLYRRGIQAPTNSTSPRGSKPQPQSLPKREHSTIQINLYQRGIAKKKGVYNKVITKDHKLNFPTKMIL